MRDDIGFRSSGLVFSGVTWGIIEGIYRGYTRDYRGDYYTATPNPKPLNPKFQGAQAVNVNHSNPYAPKLQSPNLKNSPKLKPPIKIRGSVLIKIRGTFLIFEVYLYSSLKKLVYPNSYSLFRRSPPKP